MKRGFNTDIKNRAASRDLEENNKASTSSSPISQDSANLAVPTMSQSLTLPVINNNYRKGSDSRREIIPGNVLIYRTIAVSSISAVSASSVSPAVERAPSTGLFRPLKEFARRRFINHFWVSCYPGVCLLFYYLSLHSSVFFFPLSHILLDSCLCHVRPFSTLCRFCQHWFRCFRNCFDSRIYLRKKECLREDVEPEFK